MAKIERSILIQSNWQAVDAVALDGARNGEWYSGVEQSSADDMYPQVGGVCTMIYRAGPTTFNLKQKVLEYVPGDYILFEIEGGVLRGTSCWGHTPEGDGTRVTCLMEYEASGGGLGAIADKLVLERLNTSQLEESLRNLKTLVEG
jgi:Polyketide cyclase / dehydrase and lipid transport